MAKSNGPQHGSPIRYIVGIVSLFASLITLAGGFLQMVLALERGGYGTSSVDAAIYWLGAGGGLLGLGIVLVIWELSVRHNVRH